MRSERFQQFAIVMGDSAQSLTEQLNAKLIELKDKDPVVTFEGLIARISYIERHEEPEDIAEAFQLKGAGFHCEQCPFYQPVLKRDGSKDERIKYGMCPNAKYGKAFGSSGACEKLYQMFMNGEVKLCLAEEN
jgi:hypothetical protein